jgi:hypothetical protein
MEHRLGRTLRVFLVALAAAGFYRLAVVPFVEPRGGGADGGAAMTPEEAAAIRARADRRLAAVGDLFPPGSWEREDPIMLESRQMRLLFKEYHSLPDGRVNLVPCTLVVLPDRNRVAREGATGRPFVLRAPQGAVLEFDEPLDLRQGRLARLVGGSLRGQVTIRGPATAPGADDDIEVVTRDVELEELEIRTSEMVQFRHGRSSGSGRGLVARLTPREGPAGQGPNIGGVDSVRLDRDVRIRVEGVAGSLLPGREPRPAAGAETAAQPPVLVSCRGSLCLNVSADVITLEDTVDVVRPGPDGTGGDQLSCDLLAILLGRAATPGAADAADAGPRGPLEPVEVQAKGAPVVVSSAAARLEARAARLGYEIASRRILLDGEEPVSLVVGDSEMEARKIDYCPGPPGDPGALMALGPGRLKSRPQDGEPVQVRWQQWLRMRPDGAGHVVSVAGDAEVAVEAQGRLAATEMHLWLDVVRPTAGDAAAAPPAGTGPDLSRVRPSRLLARGMVEADAAQAEARTDRLELWFRSRPEAAPAPTRAAPAAPPTAAPQPSLAAPPALAAPAAQPADPLRRPGRFVVTAGLVRGLVLVSSTGSELDEMSMEGQVRLVEPAAAAGAEPGIEIAGEQLQLSRASRFDARAIVSGRPARVRGRGLDLTGPTVEFDRGRGRVTVDGAGQLSLPVAGGAAGFEALGLTTAPAAPAAPAAPGRLDVTWQGRMDFDGLTARFVDRVVTAGGQATVNAGSLDVVLDRPFDLAAGAARPGGPPPQVARIACGSGVRIESTSVGEDGGRSQERLFSRDLVVDRVTGDVTGTGPGRLTSTRFGPAPALLDPAAPGPGGPAARPVAAPRPAAGLTFLGVDFQRGLRGNIHRRAMEFHQRVEAVWGPVATWDATLDAHAAAGLPAGVVAVSSDVLGLAQAPPMPGRERSSIELGAGGNVLVEGESFTARSARLSWSEAKDLLVFEGDGRSDAQLFRQLQPGAQPSSASAGKILYWRALERVDVEDARFLDLDQLRGGPQPAPPARPPAARPPRQPPAALPAT